VVSNRTPARSSRTAVYRGVFSSAHKNLRGCPRGFLCDLYFQRHNFRQAGLKLAIPKEVFPLTETEKSMKHTRRSTRLNDWQEAGIILGGILVDSAKLINQALPEIASSKHRSEIEQYCRATENEPYPSTAALQALKAAILTILMEKSE
jgi:hypothetical protein